VHTDSSKAADTQQLHPVVYMQHQQQDKRQHGQQESPG
jgi:hypothetical protein